MSTMTQEDPLYQIFEDHLHSGMYDTKAKEELVRDVVDYYWKRLQATGHMPYRLHDVMRADLAQDVLDMLKLKIYGHYGIGEYNRTRLNKKTS